MPLISAATWNDMVAKMKYYGLIDQTFGQYENQKYLKDMRVNIREFIGDAADEDYYLEVKRAQSLAALKELIACYVPGDILESVFTYVLEKYDAEWRRYERDKELGLVRPESEDYYEYSWRGRGPKPYFEGLIADYFKKRKHRSIDDE